MDRSSAPTDGTIRNSNREASMDGSPGKPSASPASNSAAHGAPAVPLLDMSRQYEPLREAIRAAIDRVCDSGRFILGPDCEQLEHAIASYTGAQHAIGCASGSDALLLALMALRIGPGDEVILPSYTFFATASAVWRLGATPVFVDIDPVTFNIDPQTIAERATCATKAIVPVHLFGQCADMEEICRVAERLNVPVIEDAAQAIGAGYRNRMAGTLGDIACFSFYPTKNLGGFGDGGMLTTNSHELAARLRLLRVHGMVVGINSRLDSIQAAVLNVKLPHLNRWAQLRRGNAELYHRLFAEYGLDEVLTLPDTAEGQSHVWNQYVVRVPDGRRDALRAHLSSSKIGSEIYYPVSLHQQECFRSLGYAPGSLPESERAARETLALPIFPELRELEQRAVVSRIAEFFGIHKSAVGARRPKFLDRRSQAKPKDASNEAA
jgi:dTDP-4-amino-4,6-dideoxygalactose transaminase